MKLTYWNVGERIIGNVQFAYFLLKPSFYILPSGWFIQIWYCVLNQKFENQADLKSTL